ncbi:MAG: hypothetical protein ACK5Q5_15905 [Planctomycetaceae bacterium]
MFYQSWRVAFGLAIVFGQLSGCGGANDVPKDRPQTVPATGVLTHNGQVVGGASISFINVEFEKPGASAVSADDGTFTLTTFSPGDGAIPGEYRVGVMKTEIQGADNSYFDVDSPNYGKTPPAGAEGKKVFVIPEKFNKPDTAGIKAQVSEDGGEITIDLKD